MIAKMKIMDQRGHSTLTYDTEVEEEVAPARDKFNELVGGGFVAWAIAPGITRTGTEIKEFDPTVQEIIFTHPIAGG